MIAAINIVSIHDRIPSILRLKLTQLAGYLNAQQPELFIYNNTALWYVKLKKMAAFLLFDLHLSIRTYFKNNLMLMAV
jgi:hypothetical protein